MRELKTIREWENVTGIRVLDPDGFDRKDEHLYDRKFTKDDFTSRAALSTCEWPRGKNFTINQFDSGN